MHKLRSTLTTLGIIFGVSSVIAMLAIGEGASRQAQEQIARLGSRNVIIKTVSPPEKQDVSSQNQNTMREYGLTYEDAERFHNSIPNVEVIVPSRRMTLQVRYRNRAVATEVIGTVPWYPEIAPIHTLRGRFLGSIDMHHKQGVCVIDEKVMDKLFVFDDPLGQDVKVQGDYYRVVGVVSALSAGSSMNSLNGAAATKTKGNTGANVGNIYIPLTTVKNRFGEISLQFGGGSRGAEKVELQEITVKVSSMEQVLATRDVLEALLERFHKKEDFQVVVPLELLKQARQTQRIFSIVLGSIAAISLLVGGIGIMNIMLATVSERTREI
ncbi:MAG: ABC transporter permease, partial [Sedimentisphaerales bacterium]